MHGSPSTSRSHPATCPTIYTLNAGSWLYCFDKVGNLTSQDGTASTCPSSAVFTYNDASQLTAQTGSLTSWSYDRLGNETAGGRVAATARTDETWTDYSQLAAITTGSTTYDLVHAGIGNSEL
ncbi:hypothetical protein SAMN06272735_9020 [Streptomyces sp. TLI_55]|uniref:hypothetical protein n=1 Tax=Streptomyces sp. TLI_55 TaxID=1938861 RepID=UPI000BDD6479|nr:hypothetical protein [Streptomyces sp. TLI_55]SNX88560.1 hypothetical protein SAMN06272735_9020 [Streptomyces sp. TLI_55]